MKRGREKSRRERRGGSGADISSAADAGGRGAEGKTGEIEEGLVGVPFRGRNGGRRGVADAVEVAVRGEVFDVPAGGEDTEVGFETALKAGKGGVVGE